MRIILIALLLFTPLAAQEAKAPSLSEVQRLKLQLSLEKLRTAKLVFDQAMANTETLMKSLTVDGWQLDPNTLEYVALPPKVTK